MANNCPNTHQKTYGEFLQELNANKGLSGNRHAPLTPKVAARFVSNFSAKSRDYFLAFNTLTRRCKNFISARQYGTFILTTTEQLGTKRLQDEGYYYSLYYPLYPTHTLAMGHQAPAHSFREQEHAPPKEDAAHRATTAACRLGVGRITPPTQPRPETPETAADFTAVPTHPSLSYMLQGWLASDGLPDGATASARQFSFSRE